ncbi:hypothetical protein SDC9_142488 [bioreactor metagenome]|uniref:Uncharacterized protein n=1 Tax=bioreactor metagenome TaxID=1076179 RepID=A0A645E0M2_9ZZZZ
MLLAQLLLRHRQASFLLDQIVDELLILFRDFPEQVGIRERVLRSLRGEQEVELGDPSVFVYVYQPLFQYLLRGADIFIGLLYVVRKDEYIVLDLSHLEADDVDLLLRHRYLLAQYAYLLRNVLFLTLLLFDILVYLRHLALDLLELALLLFYLRLYLGRRLRRRQSRQRGAEEHRDEKERYQPDYFCMDAHNDYRGAARAAWPPS